MPILPPPCPTRVHEAPAGEILDQGGKAGAQTAFCKPHVFWSNSPLIPSSAALEVIFLLSRRFWLETFGVGTPGS